MPALIPIGAAVAAALVSSALAPKPQKAPDTIVQPAVPKPAVIPEPDDQTAMNARKKSLAEQISRRGRASTILTDQVDKLGPA